MSEQKINIGDCAGSIGEAIILHQEISNKHKELLASILLNNHAPLLDKISKTVKFKRFLISINAPAYWSILDFLKNIETRHILQVTRFIKFIQEECDDTNI